MPSETAEGGVDVRVRQLRRACADRGVSAVPEEHVVAFVEGHRLLEAVAALPWAPVRAALEPAACAELLCDSKERAADTVDVLRTLYSYVEQLREQLNRLAG